MTELCQTTISLTCCGRLMKMVLMSVSVRQLSLLGCMLVLLAVTGCASAGSASSTRTHGELSVVTAFYPLQFVAQRVAGANAVVTNLTQPGAEPHDLELTPRQVASLTTASLVIYEKGFQPAVDEAVRQSENPQVIDTTTTVPLRPLTASGDDRGHGEGVGDDHALPDDHAGLDPHVWLDPTAVSR